MTTAQQENNLQKPELSIVRSLKYRYSIALLLIASLATAAWHIQQLVISAQESTAVIVNISGRQRMLSQRTALFSNLLILKSPVERAGIRAKLKESIDLMSRSHLGLTQGDRESGLPYTHSPTVQAMYFAGENSLDNQVTAYIHTVNELLKLRDNELNAAQPLLQYITTIASTTLVTSLDSMVRQYQLEGEAAIKNLENAETAFWLATLFLLMLEAALIFNPFIRQMRSVIKRLHKATEALQLHQEQLEEKIKARTAELELRSHELTESEEKFRLISTSAQDAIAIINADERVTYWNPAAEKIFGYSVDEIHKKNLHDWLAPLNNSDTAHQGFDAFRKSGQEKFVESAVEFKGLRKDGTVFPIELAISAFKLSNQWHALGIIRDITVRKNSDEALRISEKRFRMVLEGADLGFWDWNILSGEVERNEQWAKMLGYSFEEIKRTTHQWADFVHPDDRGKAWQSIYDVIEGRSPAHKMEYRMLHKDGSYRWILDQAKIMERDEHGNPIRMSGTHSDITERKLNEQTLRLHQFSLNHAEEEAIWVSNEARILDVNEPACRILGYSREELLNLSVSDIDPLFPVEKWAAHWQELKLKKSLRFESLQKKRDGTICPIEVVANFLEYDGIEYSCALVRDISERKRLEAELELKANIDSLTGVSNRRYFMEQAEQELARAVRYENTLAFFMLDVDFFKRINDTHGHKAGDKALEKLADVCRKTLRQVDIIGRIGGEEFAILLPETGMEESIEVAERLRESLQKALIPLETGLPLQLTVSIGVAALTSKDDNIDVLFNAADKALYAAKNSGRNKVCFVDRIGIHENLPT